MQTEAITRLPKWAQTRIRVAETRAKEADDRLAVYLGNRPTNTWVIDATDTRKPLPMNAWVRFEVSPRLEVDVKIREGELDINAERAIAILPGAANCVRVVAKSP